MDGHHQKSHHQKNQQRQPAQAEHRHDTTPPQQPAAGNSTDLAQQLAAAKGWPLDHCRTVLEAKRAELAGKGIRFPAALLRKIVAESPEELPAPAAVRRTHHQCDNRDPHGRHLWADDRNNYHCMGEERQNADGSWSPLPDAPEVAAEYAALPPPPTGDMFGNFAGAH